VGYRDLPLARRPGQKPVNNHVGRISSFAKKLADDVTDRDQADDIVKTAKASHDKRNRRKRISNSMVRSFARGRKRAA
jgi:hypothetical protein